MAGIWQKFDPELLEGYAIACPLLEKGKPRIQVLGDNTVRVICYGGARAILPTVYLYDVPDDLIEQWKSSRKDIELFLDEYSKKAQEILELLHGEHLPLSEVKELAKEAEKDLARAKPPEDVKNRSRLELTKRMLKAFLER